MLTSWAKGALIAGLNMADMDESVDLKNVSPKGIAKIKDLIIFNLISLSILLSIPNFLARMVTSTPSTVVRKLPLILPFLVSFRIRENWIFLKKWNDFLNNI